MGDTSIEWTDKTWNPVTGCSKVSEGCRNCYAERVFPRAYSKAWMPDEKGGMRIRNFTDVQTHEDRLDQPLRWKRPRRIFVNSMSDLFHEDVPEWFIQKVFAVMALAPRHTFQILTKRPERMLEYLKPTRDLRGRVLGQAWEMLGYLPKYKHQGIMERPFPLPNVHLGVSVEDQKTADERIPLLLKTPAAVRWISAEPLLGPIELERANSAPYYRRSWLSFNQRVDDGQFSEGTYTRLDWVVVGGESGPGARPMHPDWARSLRDQCQAARVPFFFKQWGEWEPVAPIYDEDDSYLDRIDKAKEYRWPEFQPPPGSWMMERVGKNNAGRLLDGREWSEFPK